MIIFEFYIIGLTWSVTGAGTNKVLVAVKLYMLFIGKAGGIAED